MASLGMPLTFLKLLSFKVGFMNFKFKRFKQFNQNKNLQSTKPAQMKLNMKKNNFKKILN